MAEKITYKWALTPADVDRLIADVTSGGMVSFDTETTGLREHARTGDGMNGGVGARIVLATFSVRVNGEIQNWILPLSHPQSPLQASWARQLRRVLLALYEHDIRLVAHHGKFDLRWAYAHAGVNATRLLWWDTMISSHLLDENESSALKEAVPREFGVARWDDHDLSKPGAAERVPLFPLGEYGAKDTYWTLRLAERHVDLMGVGIDDPPISRDDVMLRRLGDLMLNTAMPTVRALALAEIRGLRVDSSWIGEHLAGERETSSRALREIAERYAVEGEISVAATSGYFKSWTAAAVADGDLTIAALTPTGQPQWTKEVLGKQARRGSKSAELILTARQAIKRSEYLQAWTDLTTSRGTLHPTFNAGKVVTGRLSSQSPNLQQVTSSLKPAFQAREGFVIAELDFSQIELRIAAYLSRSEPMMEAYRRGDDLHTLTAAEILGIDPADVTPDGRQRGKAGNFGLLYGMTATGFQAYADAVYGVELTEEESVETYEAFFRKWEGMREWHARQAVAAYRDGYVTSPIGRVRRLPWIWSNDPGERGKAERDAINSPVQGFASDLMQMSIASITGTLDGHKPVEGAHPIGTVHDSVVLEIREEAWEEIGRECQRRMTDVNRLLEPFHVEIDVPIEAEGIVGTRWGLDDVGTLI